MTKLYNTAEHQQNIYRRWAPVYDRIYTGLLRGAHRRLALVAAEAGSDILEVGVGTGLVLLHYPPHCRVVGVDVSAEMIDKAREKVVQRGLSHVRSLEIMDAHRLAFADRSFDAVALPFVVTLLAEPERALDECVRVLRPGGQIVIASKLSTGDGLQGAVERAVAPVAHRVGLSSAFRVSRIADWAEKRGDVAVAEIQPLFPNGFFKLMRLKYEPRAAS